MLSRGISDPFREMQSLHRQMDRLISQAMGGGGAGFPAMNVYGSEDGVAITAEMPGVTKEDLELSVHRDIITLKGERKSQLDDGASWHRRERGSGRFTRTLSLPFAVDPEHVEASLSEGILKLSLRRPEEDKPRRIQINAS